VSHIVDVRYSGADWADLMADMRSWLDRRQIKAVEFNHSLLDRGVAVRVGLRDEDQAAAFATAFSGRLERTALSGVADAARNPIAGPAGEDTSASENLTTLDEAPLESARSAVKAGVSLMITRQQKADLRELGYNPEQIRDMKPEEAHRVLRLIDERPAFLMAERVGRRADRGSV
jgi:hypothetical protein